MAGYNSNMTGAEVAELLQSWKELKPIVNGVADIQCNEKWTTIAEVQNANIKSMTGIITIVSGDTTDVYPTTFWFESLVEDLIVKVLAKYSNFSKIRVVNDGASHRIEVYCSGVNDTAQFVGVSIGSSINAKLVNFELRSGGMVGAELSF